MRVLDLFSGIGGFSLGLERAGFETVAFCEIDPWARRVLRKHWPDVPCFHDIKEVHGGLFAGINIDLVCGGFPRQDISSAGKGAGLQGARSGLWFEMLRVIEELRPRWVLAENVPALRTRGIDMVQDGLDGLGYASWPLVVGAADIGAPHLRRRVWIVAYSDGKLLWDEPGGRGGEERQGAAGLVVDTCSAGPPERQGPQGQRTHSATAGAGWWTVEPDVGRVAHGIPARVDRLRGLGNAVVPQVVEAIGRAILNAEVLL